MNRQSTPDKSGQNIDEPSFYMVGWLTSLAQEHLKIVKTDDAYARYSSNIPSRFYLIQTAIADKDNLKTVGYINQADDIVFDVYVHRVGYSNTKYNQLLFWFKDKAGSLYRTKYSA